ncbi:MAG: hypothetical protein JWO60_3274 [Frankiales bacterium]|nr:hypothetical protein [Frankiales bacterium]
MNSTLLRTAPSVVDALTATGAHAGGVVLPAATCTPAALATAGVTSAVDGRMSQETSAWTQSVARGTAAAPAYVAALPAFRALTSTNVQGPPSRGTPV